MSFLRVLAAWTTVLSTLVGTVSAGIDYSDRTLQRLRSFYLDDGSCLERAGEITQRVVWNGRTWNLTAPETLVSPSSETKRTGTPLDIKPLKEFVTQAEKAGATIVNGEGAIAANAPLGLRLVMVVHNPVTEESGAVSLQTAIAVRLCASTERFSGSTLYIGPRKGVNFTERWTQRRKSKRWIEGYRDAFSLSVADALERAAGEVNVIGSRSAQ